METFPQHWINLETLHQIFFLFCRWQCFQRWLCVYRSVKLTGNLEIHTHTLDTKITCVNVWSHYFIPLFSFIAPQYTPPISGRGGWLFLLKMILSVLHLAWYLVFLIEHSTSIIYSSVATVFIIDGIQFLLTRSKSLYAWSLVILEPLASYMFHFFISIMKLFFLCLLWEPQCRVYFLKSVWNKVMPCAKMNSINSVIC